MASAVTVAAITSAGTLAGVVAGVLLQWPLEGRRLKTQHRVWLLEKRRDAYVSFLDQTRDAYEVLLDWRRLHPGSMTNEDYEKQADQVESALNKVRFAHGVVVIVGPTAAADIAKKVRARLRLDRWYYSAISPENTRDRVSQLLEEIGEETLSRAVHEVLDRPHPNHDDLSTALGTFKLNDAWLEFEKIAGDIVENTDARRTLKSTAAREGTRAKLR